MKGEVDSIGGVSNYCFFFFLQFRERNWGVQNVCLMGTFNIFTQCIKRPKYEIFQIKLKPERTSNITIFGTQSSRP